jgi:hypothetical protein
MVQLWKGKVLPMVMAGDFNFNANVLPGPLDNT